VEKTKNKVGERCPEGCIISPRIRGWKSPARDREEMEVPLGEVRDQKGL